MEYTALYTGIIIIIMQRLRSQHSEDRKTIIKRLFFKNWQHILYMILLLYAMHTKKIERHTIVGITSYGSDCPGHIYILGLLIYSPQIPLFKVIKVHCEKLKWLDLKDMNL